ERGAPASASASCAATSNCWGAGSGSRAGPAGDRASPSACRSLRPRKGREMKRTVLLVDDERDVLFATRLMLERAGYAVVEAEGGEQALAVASARRLDAIFLDLRMPEVDG